MVLSEFESCVLGLRIPATRGMMPPMKITDPRIEKEGYRVISASNGVEVLSLARQHRSWPPAQAARAGDKRDRREEKREREIERCAMGRMGHGQTHPLAAVLAPAVAASDGRGDAC
jgi:hypothetical protein